MVIWSNCEQMGRLLAVGLAVVLCVVACRSESEQVDEEPPAEESEQVAVEEEVEEEVDPTEIFGLPVPPEYESIRLYDHRARVTTWMSLDDLERFFRRTVADYEVVRTDRSVQLVPLRPDSPTAQASHFGGRRSHVVVQYRRPMEPEEMPVIGGPPLDDEEDEDGEKELAADVLEALAAADAERSRVPTPAPTARTPDWLDDVRGEPVDLRTPDGELLAPGARWGEPYVPPEGSPLDQERYRANFGRPFGDWRMP